MTVVWLGYSLTQITRSGFTKTSIPSTSSNMTNSMLISFCWAFAVFPERIRRAVRSIVSNAGLETQCLRPMFAGPEWRPRVAARRRPPLRSHVGLSGTRLERRRQPRRLSLHNTGLLQETEDTHPRRGADVDLAVSDRRGDVLVAGAEVVAPVGSLVGI